MKHTARWIGLAHLVTKITSAKSSHTQIGHLNKSRINNLVKTTGGDTVDGVVCRLREMML